MNRPMITALAVLSLIPSAFAQGENYQSLVASHAAANGVPASLVHRVIMRESRYNPHAVSKGNYGMMQIRLGTARGLGYTGSAAGLLDPDTNLTYAVRYLAGAYRAAGGNESRAVSYYAGGYYYAAKRQGLAQQQAQTVVQPSLFDANAQLVDASGQTVAPRHRHSHRRHHRHHRH